MIKSQFNVWKASASQDERGGNVTVIGYYTNHSDALHDVKGQGFWGADGKVDSTPVTVISVDVEGKTMFFPLNSAITIFDKNRTEREEQTKRLKMSALSKLTPDEIKALGLGDSK